MYARTAKARPATPTIRQQFMLPDGPFEFGPLLAGRDRAGHLDGSLPEHTAKLRITNTGLFPLHADFWLKSEGAAADPATAPDGAKKKGAALRAPAAGAKGSSSGAAPASPFVLQPSSLDLGLGETAELSVFAFPAAEGLLEDVVMCRCVCVCVGAGC